MNLKKLVGEAAVEYVKDGMVLGLGTGSTVRYSIFKIGKLVKTGLKVLGIPTSKGTEKLAKDCGIPLTNLNEHPEVDLTIDCADEVDPNLNLTKCMGGALFREKIVANSSKEMIVVVDESKMVEKLGTKSPLPVEVLPFSWKVCQRKLRELDCVPTLRKKGKRAYETDNGNYIIDCKFEGIEDPKNLERDINSILGVLENGLFLDLADIVLVGKIGGIEKLRKII